MPEEEDNDSTVILTADEILAELDKNDLVSNATEKQALYEQNFSLESIDREAQYIRLQALKDHFKLKNEWSSFIKNTLIYLLGFQSILLLLVGIGWLNFKEYEWLLPTLLVQTLAHVVALAVIVVKSLFDK